MTVPWWFIGLCLLFGACVVAMMRFMRDAEEIPGERIIWYHMAAITHEDHERYFIDGVEVNEAEFEELLERTQIPQPDMDPNWRFEIVDD